MLRSKASAARMPQASKRVPKPRPLARKRGELKREKILRAAAVAFAARGYSATTLDDIAAACGTQAGSLYYHFSSRDHITREVLKCSMSTIRDKVQDALSKLPPGTPAIQRIRVGIKAHMRVALSDDPFPPAYNRIINEVSPSIREEYVQHPRAYGRIWRDLLLESQKAGEIRRSVDTSVMRLLLFGSVTWSQVWFDRKGARSVDEVADILLDIFFNGILTKKGETALGERSTANALKAGKTRRGGGTDATQKTKRAAKKTSIDRRG